MHSLFPNPNPQAVGAIPAPLSKIMSTPLRPWAFLLFAFAFLFFCLNVEAQSEGCDGAGPNPPVKLGTATCTATTTGATTGFLFGHTGSNFAGSSSLFNATNLDLNYYDGRATAAQ